MIPLPLSNMLQMLLKAIFLSSTFFDVVICAGLGCGLFGCLSSGSFKKEKVGTLVPPEELVRVRVENNGAFAQYRTGAMLKKDIVLIGDEGSLTVFLEDVNHQAFVEFGSGSYLIIRTEVVGNKSLVCKLESAIEGLSTTFEIGTGRIPVEGLIGGYSWLSGICELVPEKASRRRSNGDLVLGKLHVNCGSVYYTYDQRGGVPHLHAVCTGMISDNSEYYSTCTDMHLHRDQITDLVIRLSAATNEG